MKIICLIIFILQHGGSLCTNWNYLNNSSIENHLKYMLSYDQYLFCVILCDLLPCTTANAGY